MLTAPVLLLAVCLGLAGCKRAEPAAIEADAASPVPRFTPDNPALGSFGYYSSDLQLDVGAEPLPNAVLSSPEPEAVVFSLVHVPYGNTRHNPPLRILQVDDQGRVFRSPCGAEAQWQTATVLPTRLEEMRELANNAVSTPLIPMPGTSGCNDCGYTHLTARASDHTELLATELDPRQYRDNPAAEALTRWLMALRAWPKHAKASCLR